MLRSDLDSDTPGVFATITADASFTDDGVKPGRSYVYRVVAVNDDGDSPHSDSVTVDTPAEPEPDTTEPESGSEPELLELPEFGEVSVVENENEDEPPPISALQQQAQTEFVVTTEVTSNAITGPYQQPALHDTIWSATLTVGELTDPTGTSRGYVPTHGSLSGTTFDYRGTQRTVYRVENRFTVPPINSRETKLQVLVPDGGSDLDPNTVLSVGDTQLSLDSTDSARHVTQTIDGVPTPSIIYVWNDTDLGLVDGETVEVSLSTPVFGLDGVPVSGRLVASAASEPEDAGWVSHTYPTACRVLHDNPAPGRLRHGDSYLGCARDLESQWFVVSLQDDRDYEIEILTDTGARLVPYLAHASLITDPTHRITWGARRYDVCETVRNPPYPNRRYCRSGRDWLRVDTRRSDLHGGEYLVRVTPHNVGNTNPDYRIRVREQ